MPKYAVILEGRNFPVVTDKGVQLLGFYATRKVKAGDEQEAALTAMEMVRSDPELLSVVDRDKTTQPKLFVKNTEAISWWDDMKSSGYTFFPMKT
ncbi:MAG: hypothetical protein K6L60_06000 [Oceanobacter sp.]|jgi:hypothetical protein